MNVIFSGIFYSKKSFITDAIKNKTINLVSPAISENKTIIETPFSQVIAGRRKGCQQSYYDFFIIEASDSKTSYKGFLAGNLYNKSTSTESSKKVNFLEVNIIRKIVETKGQYLSENFWGQYILLCQDLENKKIYIFPDPIGYSSLFYAETEQGILFSSDLWCLADQIEKNISINYFVSQLSSMGGLLNSNTTPFSGIKELPHGNCIIITNDNFEITEFWNPCNTKILDSKNKGCLEVFFDVISAQIKENHNTSLFLSGGSDSSSLLMALKHLKPTKHLIEALNLRDLEVSSSDESKEATRIADSLGINLNFYDWDNPYSLMQSSNMYMRFDKPHVSLLNRRSIIEQENIMLKNGDTVFWSGHGGDHLFCQGNTVYKSIADYWIKHKNKGITKKIIELCALHKIPLAMVLKDNIQALWKYYRGDHQQHDLLNFGKPKWLLPEFHNLEYDRDAIYPYFFEDLKNCPPAKAIQVLSIYEGVNQTKVSEKLNRVPTIYPFFAQPLVEFALALPVYESFDKFDTRLPFREEIRNFFKNNIVLRSTKGETSGMLQRGIEQNIREIYALCLDGYCAKQKILNTRILEEHIEMVRGGKVDELHSILNLISVELWCRDWGL
ncbi:asparagine synthase-related protein [Candidatus Finniella inopinata]|uniref:asparagine synthase (glutamine-hydrolyzing) n=1 Tax=Candidatus Finniella inopinata TaxID=1696036 RepID=A0A4Q7DJU6_9PROT|nr:asparagine synthase-related protein [Candidatus Finniella inopinata]RZI46630.1 hypothetical protein EQU50_03320 [Candidatus Finniella inopinata]